MKSAKWWRGKPARLLLVFLAAALLLTLFSRLPQPMAEESGASGWMLRFTDPPRRAAAWVDRSVRAFFQRLRAADQLQRENRELRRELTRANMERDLLTEELKKLERVGRLIPNTSTSDVPLVAANIISFSADPAARTIKIDRGAEDGLRPNLPVIDANGLLGITEIVLNNSARVRLTSDRQFTVAAMIRETRLQGFVTGSGRSGECQFHFDDLNQRIQPHQEVMTSGMAGERPSLLPKGLRIGTVVRLERDSLGQNYAVVRLPAEVERLEQVTVMVLPPEE